MKFFKTKKQIYHNELRFIWNVFWVYYYDTVQFNVVVVGEVRIIYDNSSSCTIIGEKLLYDTMILLLIREKYSSICAFGSRSIIGFGCVLHLPPFFWPIVGTTPAICTSKF